MILASIYKEFQLLWRDRGSLASLFVLPIAFMMFTGWVYHGAETSKPRLLVVAPKHGEMAGAIALALENLDGFKVSRSVDETTMRATIENGDADAGLVVPASPGPDTPCRMLVAPELSPTIRAPMELIVTAVVARMMGDPACRAPLDRSVVQMQSLGDNHAEPSSGFQLSVPGNVVLFAFFLAVTIGISFIEERRRGTWRRLRAAPVSLFSLLASKLVPYFLIGLGQIGFLFSVGIFVFSLNVQGSLAALALVASATVFCTIGMGLLLASLGRTEKAVGAIASVLLLVTGMLGGTMIPRTFMPKAMQAIGAFTPQAFALDAFSAIVMRPDAGLATVALPVAVLLGFGVVFLLVGVSTFPTREA
jgi:ABC-2 type transport system permease protein